MAQFIDPFPGKLSNGKLTPRELTRALRQALAAEEEATHLYEAIADATDRPEIAELLQDIADEERVHKGEFQAALERLLPDEAKLVDEGRDEANDAMGKEKKAMTLDEARQLAVMIKRAGTLQRMS